MLVYSIDRCSRDFETVLTGLTAGTTPFCFEQAALLGEGEEHDSLCAVPYSTIAQGTEKQEEEEEEEEERTTCREAEGSVHQTGQARLQECAHDLQLASRR